MQVTPLQKTSDFVRLDVLVSLGIPGLSEFTGRRRLWAVTAHLSRVMQKDQATSDLTLDGSAEDDRRIERIVSYVDRMSEELLFRYSDAEELYTLVKDSGLSFAKHGPELDDEFARLHLDPWNALARLELAGVYAGHLRHLAAVNEIMEAARTVAASRWGLDTLLPKIQENIEAAQR